MKNILHMRSIGIMVVLAAVMTVVSCGGDRRNTVAGESADRKAGISQTINLSDSLLAYRGADTIDMGRVKEGEIVVKNIAFHNSGDKPLVMVEIDKTCGCIDAHYTKTPLKPGESGEIELELDSRGFNGWMYKTVGLHTSLGQKPYILVVTAEVE